MKNYVILPREKDYDWPSEYTNDNIYSLMRLITNYGSNADWLQRNIKKGSQEGVVGGSMEVIIENNLAHIQPVFGDDAEDHRVTLPADTLRFIVNRWQELVPLKPDSITISEEDGKYSISAEFKAPAESTQEEAAKEPNTT